MKVKVLDSSSTNLVSMEFIELSVNQRPDYDDENNIPKIIIFLLENLIHLSFNVVDSARCNPMLDFKSSTEPPPCYYIKQHSIEKTTNLHYLNLYGLVDIIDIILDVQV
ncbi:15029_t:CDS:2 [Entrophospora sp. SA101]|nr:15029_t:CDS:2 [Entrophospora sp. SA101]